MIHEEICTYEVCKLAKEKGFPQHIGDDAYIVENEYDDKYEVGCHYPIQFIPDYLPTITAPTQSLLQRWLREEKGITICVDIFDDGWFFDISTFYKQDTRVYEVDIPYKSSNVSPVYDTYELALEDALKYALENLV
jgi:hypothetical protein